MGLAWNLLGLSEFETRNYKASLQHLQRAQEAGLGDNPDADNVGKYHIALLLNLNGEFEKATDLLVSEFGKSGRLSKSRLRWGLRSCASLCFRSR